MAADRRLLLLALLLADPTGGLYTSGRYRMWQGDGGPVDDAAGAHARNASLLGQTVRVAFIRYATR